MRRESPSRRTYPSGREAWEARVRDDRGKKVNLGTRKLKRDAQRLIDDWYEAGRPRDRTTVGAFAADWTERFPRTERTDRTNNSRLRAVLDVRISERRLADWPFSELKRKHVLELVDHMLRVQGRAVGGVQGHLRTLSAMTEDAYTDEVTDQNPFKGVRVRANDRRAQKPARENRLWSWEEMHRFAASGGQHEPMIRMLADCGMRVGELLGLQRELQDLKNGTFTVKGSAWNGQLVESSREKRHDRQGPIPPTCLALLRAMPVRIDSPWLFPTPGSRRVGKKGFDRPGGQLWRYDNWRKQVWLPTCEAAGLDPTPQEFRASYNSLLLAADVDRADLSDVLGHSEDVNAARYTLALRRSGDVIRALIG